MELIHFVTTHGFDAFGTVAIIASVLFAAFEVRHLEKAQRITNHLTLNSHHREIWSEFYKRPDLARVVDPKVNLVNEPIKAEESLFVTFVILHLHATFKASKARMFAPPDSLGKDVAQFFALPIPKAVWESSKALQDTDFAEFVDRSTSAFKS